MGVIILRPKPIVNIDFLSLKSIANNAEAA